MDRGDGRDALGRFTGSGGYGADAEAQGLQDYSDLTGREAIPEHVQAKLPDSPQGRTVEATIERAVRMIDGDRHFAVSLWALPPDTPIDLVNRDEWPQEYIQAAGEGSERLTAEVRRRDDAGGYEQFVIGRPGATLETPSETLSWPGGHSTVTPNEVLAADDVVDLFGAYYATGDVPPAFSRRPLTAPARQ